MAVVDRRKGKKRLSSWWCTAMEGGERQTWGKFTSEREKPRRLKVSLGGCLCSHWRREVRKGAPEGPKIDTFLLGKMEGPGGIKGHGDFLFSLTTDQLFLCQVQTCIGFFMHLSALIFYPSFVTWSSTRLAQETIPPLVLSCVQTSPTHCVVHLFVCFLSDWVSVPWRTGVLLVHCSTESVC